MLVEAAAAATPRKAGRRTPCRQDARSRRYMRSRGSVSVSWGEEAVERWRSWWAERTGSVELLGGGGRESRSAHLRGRREGLRTTSQRDGQRRILAASQWGRKGGRMARTLSQAAVQGSRWRRLAPRRGDHARCKDDRSAAGGGGDGGYLVETVVVCKHHDIARGVGLKGDNPVSLPEKDIEEDSETT